jgi:hypothetical protein
MQGTATLTPGDLVRIINADWANPYFGAVPYLDALEGLTTWDCSVEFESARALAPYLLNNLRTYKGETARFVKAQLKEVSK